MDSEADSVPTETSSASKVQNSDADNQNKDEEEVPIVNTAEPIIEQPQNENTDEITAITATTENIDKLASDDSEIPKEGLKDSEACIAVSVSPDNEKNNIESVDSSISKQTSEAEESTNISPNTLGASICHIEDQNKKDEVAQSQLVSISTAEITDTDTMNVTIPDGQSTSNTIVDSVCTLNTESTSEVDVAQEKSSDIIILNSALDASEKDMIEKNVIEPENTEFVQFSQDKQDDSQIEGQSMDAEDPFGGDNLISENVDQMETEMSTDTDVGFSKLCSQDNLREAVSVRDNNFCTTMNEDRLESQRELDVEKAVAVNTPGSISEDTSTCLGSAIDTSDGNSVNLQVTELDTVENRSKDNESLNKSPNHESTKAAEDVAPMETEEDQSNVLPGQDDELCIIPDSMKVIIPGEASNASVDETGKSISDKGVADNEAELRYDKVDSQCSRESTNIDSVSPVGEGEVDGKKEQGAQTQTSRPENASILADVISIDDESKFSEVEEIASKETCKQCGEERSCKIKVKIGADSYNVCSKTCKALFKAANNRATDIPSDGVNSKREKRCASCLLIVEPTDERNLSWETMEFCNEECLGKFQAKYGSYCRNCNGSVQAVSLGKYCVRFGYDVRQFCCSTCLEEFKKGLKVCSYCQKDISSGTEGFLAPVGDKGQFKDFCTQDCMGKYSKMSCTEPVNVEKKSCSVCQEEKIVHCEVQVGRGSPVAICSEPCFAAFKFVNKVDPDQCSTCKKFFELPNKKSFVVFYEKEAHTFCTKTCLNIFIITNRKIVPCNWCKVKKYNFDMIKKELKAGQIIMMCSLNCLTLYQVSINAVSAKRINCDFCKEFSQAQYHLTMSDATIRNFCSYNCVMNFQSQYTKSPITIPSSDDPVPTGMPKKTILQRNQNQTAQNSTELQNKKTMPVISSVTSLATIGNGQASPTTQQGNVNNLVVAPTTATVQSQTPQIVYKQQIITRPPSPVKVHNKTTQCKPIVHTKGVSVRPHPCSKSTQTDDIQRMVVPIPVPIYVPFPMHMYSMPFPVPLPFPLPIPVPIFIPTTRNSAKGIFKDIKRIQEKIPADPFEAELLMMAEMVATEKKANESDSDSGDDRDGDGYDHEHSHTDGFSPEGVDSSNTFGDDMLQMALKMATGELDEPAVDLEAALTPNTITATQAPPQPETAIDNDVQAERLIAASRGRKRMVPYKPRSTPNKRGRRVSGANDMPLMPPPEPQPPPQPRIMEPIEKPDANMALKYTFGVNAWRQWVVAKNAELEKQNTPTRKMKLFKTDLLQLTADELNYSLCLFVKEVRKPNGAEYAPDTIYYLCLGIQQYLFENNRIDNIFTDSYYEKFTDCLNEVAKKFSVLYNDAQYIVTRVEEEHLWECKQLGAHSPHVLLSTLMFFNTKHFNLVTVEEHMQLSFSHIMKHWKRNPAAQPAAVAGKMPGSRNVLLRFYPPQSALDANSRKKKVYEQQENEENPLRCPVKLYEFYLSKCPESVKTRNDVFYLLPERSCVPDSPVWYSTSPLAKEHLVKMLYRVKMVKEINVALLTS